MEKSRHVQREPVLLVDVDGVISTWDWPESTPPPGVWTLLDGTLHHLSSRAAETLRGLEGQFACVWCTGWEERANEHLPGLVGLGPWPYLSFDRAMGGARSFGHWKLAAIDLWAGPDRPVAWVDDAFTAPCEAWAAARPGPTLLVATEPGTGMTEEHGARLRAWAAEIASG